MRNQSWLSDAYTAAATRPPMPSPAMDAGPMPPWLGASHAAVPALLGRAPVAAPAAQATGTPAMPALGLGPGAIPSTSAPAAGGPGSRMTALISALHAAHLGDNPASPMASAGPAPPAPPSAATGAPGPAAAPTAPWYASGTTPAPGAPTPASTSAPWWTKGGVQTGGVPLGSAGNPIRAGQEWLTKLLSDPYNFQMTDAGERASLDAANNAFDAARSRMRSDALESGAGEGGVAQGESKGLELARGAAQAKNVRDWEQYKAEMGDKRLQSLLIPYMNAINGKPGTSSDSSTGQWLQYASILASLFA